MLEEGSIGLRRILRSALIASVTTAAVCGAVLPADADGTTHRFGDMVGYPLTFPVPDAGSYQDWFWAARAGGTHHAQDLFAAKGSPVVAAAAGTVVRANASWVSSTAEPDGCCSLWITHDDGWRTVYLHLDNDTPGTDDGAGWGLAPGIEVGVHVDAGQVIGYVGDSGNAEDTSPHLHFELHDPDGVIVNPYDALRAAQQGNSCSPADPGDLGALLSTSGLIRVGSTGTPVAQLQRLARTFGHDPGPIDGVFGPRTHEAVTALQADLGVAPDGIVGDRTRAAIASRSDALNAAGVLDPYGRLIRTGSVGGDVADLQVLLGRAGYDPGPADGVFGPLTRAAVTGFQADAGIGVDGVVGAETRRALADLLGLGALLVCPG